MRDGAQLLEHLRARLAAQDAAVEVLESTLLGLADTLGDRIEAALGGRPEGETAFELALDGLSDTDQVRVAVLATQLDDVVQLVHAAGLDAARVEWLGTYGKLQDLAEDAMRRSGVDNADALLDTEALGATIDALVNRHDDALFGKLGADAGRRILDALHTQVGLETVEEVAQRIADTEARSVPAALNEAQTRIAEADRFFAEMAVQEAEAQGAGEFLRVYVGPDDAITRPFCDALVGKAFATDELQGLRNGQTPTHPLVSGGGYRCRHSWSVVRAEDLDVLGYTRGTAEDIAAANAGGAKGRGKRKRGRR